MIVTPGRKMLLFTINCSTALKTQVDNVTYADRAASSLTGLGLQPFDPPRHPTFSPCQAWFVPITGLVMDRFECDLTVFANVTEQVDSYALCQRAAYAFKQAMGTAGESLDSNELATAMNTNGDMASIFVLNDPFSVCSFSCQDYDRVLSEYPVTSTGIVATVTTSPTVDSSNARLEGQRIGPTVTQQVRRGVVAATSEQTASTLASLAHNTANAARNVAGDISDGVASIAGSNQLIKFAVYGLVIFGVVTATTKLIQSVKN